MSMAILGPAPVAWPILRGDSWQQESHANLATVPVYIPRLSDRCDEHHCSPELSWQGFLGEVMHGRIACAIRPGSRFFQIACLVPRPVPAVQHRQLPQRADVVELPANMEGQ